MKKILSRTLALAAMALGLLGATARADTVLLKNGRKIEGKIVVDTDKEIAIDHQGTVMRFEKRYVAKVERSDPDEGPKPVVTKPVAREDLAAKDADLPTGATEDEADRWRRLRQELRDAAGRVREAQADLEQARSTGRKEQIQLAQEREGIAEKALDKLRAARSAIETAAKGRLATNERLAKVESDGMRASLEAERARGDIAAITSLAQDAHVKVARAGDEQVRRRAFLDVESEAHAAAGDLLLAEAQKKNDRAAMIDAARELSLAWKTGDEASALRTRHRGRAIDALTTAHRLTPRATSSSDVELLLLDAFGFEALAQLVEEGLEKRRWGALVREDESGRFKLELEDGRTVYSDEIPTNRFARIVWERRETNEPPPPPKPGEPTVIGRSRAQRWYELSWDPKLRLWAQESESVKLLQRVPALARDASPIAEELVRVTGEHVRATRDLAVQRDKLSRALRQADEGTASEDACTQAVQARDASEKTLAAVTERRAGLEKRVKEKRLEIEALIRAAERARKE